MSFIQNAQEIMPENIALIREIMGKVASGDNTVEELTQLAEFQKTVAVEVANRDREKNLAILNGRVYSVQEVLKASGYNFKDVTDQFDNITDLLANAGYNKDQQEAYFKKLVKKPAAVAATYIGVVGNYKIGGADTVIEFKQDAKMTKTTKESFAKLPIKTIVEGFVPEFIDHLTVKGKKTLIKGTKSGEVRYPEVAAFAKRMGVDSAKLMTALNVKEGLPVVEEAPKTKAKP
jgi:hypothetical protein